MKRQLKTGVMSSSVTLSPCNRCAVDQCTVTKCGRFLPWG